MQKERATHRQISKSAFAEVLRLDFIEPNYDQEISLPAAVSELSNAIAKHIHTSKHIRRYVEDLKKRTGHNCPDSPVDEIIKYLADQTGQIDKSEADINLRFIDTLMFPIFDFERECFRKLFCSNKDVNYFEFNLFAYSIELGELVDELYYEWFKMIVVDYQDLKPDEKKDYEKKLRSQLSYFDYTVYNYVSSFTSEKKIFNRDAWAVHFPFLIKEIVDTLEELADSCIESGEQEFYDYFLALSKAYACKEIENLEEAWAEVDEAWIKIPTTCRMFPIHGMENGYEHPYGVSPEYKLVIRTDYGENWIDGVRSLTPIYANMIGIDFSLVTLAKLKLTNLDMGVFSTVMNSGVCANFRSAGQVVPNRQDILSEGGKVFMNLESSQINMTRAQTLLKAYCTPEIGDKLSKLLTVDHFLLHTIGHECSHPVGCTSESDKALGEAKSRLEEAKATIGGLGVILHNRSLEEYPEIVAMCIARVCRFFKKETFENPTLQPYVRENLVMANLLVSSRIVSLKSREETTLDINLGGLNLLEFKQRLRDFYRDVIDKYHSDNPVDDILKMEKIYCFENQTICNWMKLVNRK